MFEEFLSIDIFTTSMLDQLSWYAVATYLGSLFDY